MRKGFYLCHIHIPFQVDALCLLRKYDRYLEMPRGQTRDPDAGSLDGQNLCDRRICKSPFKFRPHLIEQSDIHLMIQKAVYLQDISLFYNAVA